MRRLSAIMFTDMVGYSSLTQKNEALALELLEEHRKLLRPLFVAHGGREIETAGDSFFVEFTSAVEATQCAIEIQILLHERNLLQPTERQILLRIGLHIGDVVYVENHVHGDGVNIAARLEPLATPGGICLSEDVARQIRNKIDHEIVPLGAERLKNISMSMNIYCVALPWIAVNTPPAPKSNPKKRIPVWPILVGLAIITGAFLLYYFKPATVNAQALNIRLAVLPLANFSNDPQEEYFADGMTEELISSLSKISGLNVIARTSIMKYKASNKDISQIARELMVGAILEGSVRKVENKARITVKLINVDTQENIWSENFDRELSDIFDTQSEIARFVADQLKVRLVPSEEAQLEKKHTNNSEAYNEYLIGKQNLNKRTSEGIQQARVHFEKSISLDPGFDYPYVSLAYCYTLIGVAGYGNFPHVLAAAKAKEAVMKALEIDSTLAEAHATLGYIKFRIDWDWKGAEASLKKAIALKPNYATAHEWYALFLGIQGRLDESLSEMKKAYALDPLSPNINTGLARVYHFRKEYQNAITQIDRTISLDSNYADAHFSKGMTYHKMGQFEEALPEMLKAVKLSGRRPVMLGMLGRVYSKMGRMDDVNALLKELSTPPVTNDKIYATAVIMVNIGKQDEAFDIFEKLVDEKYGILVYMKVEREFFDIEDSPRFRKLLQRMGLE